MLLDKNHSTIPSFSNKASHQTEFAQPVYYVFFRPTLRLHHTAITSDFASPFPDQFTAEVALVAAHGYVDCHLLTRNGMALPFPFRRDK